MRTIAVGEEVTRYAVNLSRATRPGPSALDFVSKWVGLRLEPEGFPVYGSGGARLELSWQVASTYRWKIYRLWPNRSCDTELSPVSMRNRKRSAPTISSLVCSRPFPCLDQVCSKNSRMAHHEQFGREIQVSSPVHRPRGAVLHSQSAPYRQKCGGRIHCGSSPLTLFRLQSGFCRVPRLYAG